MDFRPAYKALEDDDIIDAADQYISNNKFYDIHPFYHGKRVGDVLKESSKGTTLYRLITPETPTASPVV